MVSRPCGAVGYIALGIVVVGLEQKQKLDLRWELMKILFAGCFG